MTRPSPEVERAAERRLASDEARITGSSRRSSQTLGQAWRAFWRHPSPWLISASLTGAVAWRAAVSGLAWTDLVVPVALVAFFPLIEWVIHVVVLHWRPRRLGPVAVDSLLARKHRAHHADPRELPLVFIPWQVELWLLPAYAVVAVVAFPTASAGATTLLAVNLLMAGYEWVHYLVHSDYRPRSRAFRAVWRNHRLHHYKNEHYWFTVTTAGTADRLLGTFPEPGEVSTSPTVRALHAQDQQVS
jgi:hypothetical protein